MLEKGKEMRNGLRERESYVHVDPVKGGICPGGKGFEVLSSGLLPSNASSLIPTDTGCGYRQPRARLGRKQVRPWKWMQFTNPAREVSELALAREVSEPAREMCRAVCCYGLYSQCGFIRGAQF